MFKRAQYQELINRLNEDKLLIQVVVGARQVGKTTLIRQVLEAVTIPYKSVSADDVVSPNQTWLSTLWEDVRLYMRTNQLDEYLLVVDEIQKIPNWSETVKAEWDKDIRENRTIKVILLGSSRTLIMQGLTESLAGRFELIRLPHWSYNEMKEAFGWTVEQYIYYGGYPGAAPFIANPSRWKTYVLDALIEPSIARDVLFLTKILKPQLLRQLFEIGASYSGELLALKKLAAQLQDVGNSTTLAGYLTLLDEAGLLAGLQKYANDKARRYNSIPKFQVHNSALRNVYEEVPLEQAITNSQLWGRLAESAVGAYLIAQAPICNFSVYYWREANEEVDFVLKQGNKLVAIEVKSGRRQKNRGVEIFVEQFHPYKTLVVGGDAFPIEQFLSMDLRLLFL